MLPEKFKSRLKEIVGEGNFEQVVSFLQTPKRNSVRINTLKISSIDKPELKPVTWYKPAYSFDATLKETITRSEAFHKGELYLQNLSSMIPVIALNPQPGEEILDLTAAPGSKTTQIAAHMQNQGRLAAIEKSKSRFFRLKQNLEKQGVTCAETYNKDGRMIWKLCPERFDRILLDAPCSSEARFDKDNPVSYRYWSEKKIKEMARNQWALLSAAWQALKPGGVLVYSTCSFAPEENEEIIAKLVKKRKAEIQPIALEIPNRQPGLTTWRQKEFPTTMQNCLRILPTEEMSGFFVCLLIKSKV